MSQVDETALIKQVVEACCTDEKTARQYLELFNWEINEAVSNILCNADESGEVEEGFNLPDIVSGNNSTPDTSVKRSTEPHRNIVTFESISQISPQDADEDSQAFYVGGAEHGGGGQQVLGPPRPKIRNPEEFVQDVFRAAREGGAETLDKNRVDDLEKASSSGETDAFAGAGYRLGECISEPMVKVHGKPVNLRPRGGVVFNDNDEGNEEDGDEHSVIVKMWQDGFSLNDEPLRSYTAPDSLQFLNSIRQGHIPEELTHSARNRAIHVLLEDHHSEAWTPPAPPKLKAFSGAGRILGNPTPLIINTPRVSEEAPQQRIQGPPVDETKPVTQIQVRMPDGSKLLIKLNHDHTVQDLRSAIISERPELGSQTFSLLMTFPRIELTDSTVTLADAQVLNSAIVLSQK